MSSNVHLTVNEKEKEDINQTTSPNTNTNISSQEDCFPYDSSDDSDYSDDPETTDESDPKKFKNDPDEGCDIPNQYTIGYKFSENFTSILNRNDDSSLRDILVSMTTNADTNSIDNACNNSSQGKNIKQLVSLYDMFCYAAELGSIECLKCIILFVAENMLEKENHSYKST